MHVSSGFLSLARSLVFPRARASRGVRVVLSSVCDSVRSPKIGRRSDTTSTQGSNRCVTKGPNVDRFRKSMTMCASRSPIPIQLSFIAAEKEARPSTGPQARRRSRASVPHAYGNATRSIERFGGY
eukprot:3541354-Prymnesium_polylepis.2